MPKSLINQRMLDEINCSSFLIESKLTQYLSTVARQPCFARSKSILSVFGGADITPVVLPSANTVYIIDRNPFLTKETVRSQDVFKQNAQDQSGLFHADIAKLMVECSPHSYASMPNGADYDSPYGVLVHEMYHGSSIIEESPSTMVKALYENFQEQQRLDWKGIPGNYHLHGLGISTILLTRLIVCCQAIILDVQEIIENGVYKIDIEKETGETCSVYYVQSELGKEQNADDLAYQWLLHEIDKKGVDTVMSKGWPSSFFNTAHKGNMIKIKEDARTLVRNASVQTCAYITVSGDECPPIFDSNHASIRPLMSQSELQTLYVGGGEMIGRGIHSRNALPFNPGVVSFRGASSSANSSSSASNNTLKQKGTLG